VDALEQVRSTIKMIIMDDKPQTTISESRDEIDANGVSGDCDCISLKKGEGEDVSSHNSATASISSSSSSSLASADENNATLSSLSTSFDSSKDNGFDEKNLWWIHGNGYDLKDFVKIHPGGIEAILLGKGRDCTALVESYHAFSGDKVWKVLEKFKCPKDRLEDEDDVETDEFATAQGISLAGTKHSSERVPDFFYEVLKKRVTKVLHSKGIDPLEDRGASQIRSAYYLVVLVSWLYTGYLHFSANLWGSFAFAITGWLMGALGHDAGHFAASRWAIINEYGVWAMSFICNPIMWQQQHTYGHHSFTNEFDRDPDLHHFDALLRVHKRFRYESRFRFQSNSLFVLFSYLFVVFGTCFWIPWGVLKEGTLYGIVDWHDKDRPTKFYGMLFHLICYVGIVVLVPMYTHLSLGNALLATYIHVATLGITFALFSQINHLNEPSLESDMDSRLQRQEEMLRQGRDPRLATSWGAAQVETANNFASDSIFWHILSNGLNHQIEHHLFPGLNHCHLHHIAPVVKYTCEEFGVQYKSYDTWKGLMDATLEWFDKLSVNDDNDDIASTSPGTKTIKIS